MVWVGLALGGPLGTFLWLPSWFNYLLAVILAFLAVLPLLSSPIFEIPSIYFPFFLLVNFLAPGIVPALH